MNTEPRQQVFSVSLGFKIFTMDIKVTQLLAKTLGLQPQQIKNTVELLIEGATVPFISRYRKEKTGSLDEVQVAQVKEGFEKFEELEKRKNTILSSIEEQGLLTAELKAQIENCYQPTELEDIYLPFKPKRKTKASVARERGLEPLAKILMKQYENDPESKAYSFLSPDIETIKDALAGARDIIAEWINEHAVARNIVRQKFEYSAKIRSKLVKGKEEEGEKYQDYFDWEEPLKKCPSHRLLAMRRGENEGFLKVSIAPDESEVLEKLESYFVKGRNESSQQVSMAVKDSYKRLLHPSIETEFANLAKERADKEAINVFAENLKQLLLAAPLGQKRVLAIDPGFQVRVQGGLP